MKCIGSTGNLLLILPFLSIGEDDGIPGVAVECVDIWKNTSCEGGHLPNTDAEARKLGERTGLDTLVVLAVNDGH